MAESSERDQKAWASRRIAAAVAVALVVGGVSGVGVRGLPPSNLVDPGWAGALIFAVLLGSMIGSTWLLYGTFEAFTKNAKSLSTTLGYAVVGGGLTLAGALLVVWVTGTTNRDTSREPQRCVGEARAVQKLPKGKKQLTAVCRGEDEFVAKVDEELEGVQPGDKVEVTWYEGRLWRWGTVKPLPKTSPR